MKSSLSVMILLLPSAFCLLATGVKTQRKNLHIACYPQFIFVYSCWVTDLQAAGSKMLYAGHSGTEKVGNVK